MNVLHTKFPQTMNYSKKMIKERYLTYLKESIKQEPWTLEEDMTLIRMLQKGIKRWRTIAQALPGRTELHLKNRYYGCLRSIERKVEKQMQKNNIKHEM